MCAIINFEGFWETFHRESVSSFTLIFFIPPLGNVVFYLQKQSVWWWSYVHQHQGKCSDVWLSGNLKQGLHSLICFLSKSLERNARRRFYADVWNGTNGCFSKECVSRQIWLFIKALIKAEQFIFSVCKTEWTHMLIIPTVSTIV